jgi:hypothetical protein
MKRKTSQNIIIIARRLIMDEATTGSMGNQFKKVK